jgi:hypothetical protein
LFTAPKSGQGHSLEECIKDDVIYCARWEPQGQAPGPRFSMMSQHSANDVTKLPCIATWDSNHALILEIARLRAIEDSREWELECAAQGT